MNMTFEHVDAINLIWEEEEEKDKKVVRQKRRENNNTFKDRTYNYTVAVTHLHLRRWLAKG